MVVIFVSVSFMLVYVPGGTIAAGMGIGKDSPLRGFECEHNEYYGVRD